MIPVLLLDIDGVLNGAPNLCGWNRPPHVLRIGLTVRYEPEVVDRLRDLHISGAVEVRWCTTWCGIPEVLERLSRELGLPFEPAFADRPMSKTWGDLKLESALAVLTEGRQLIWVDDEETSAARRLFPAIAKAEAEGRALLVEPASEYGLQPEHFEMIEAYVSVTNLEAA